MPSPFSHPDEAEESRGLERRLASRSAEEVGAATLTSGSACIRRKPGSKKRGEFEVSKLAPWSSVPLRLTPKNLERNWASERVIERLVGAAHAAAPEQAVNLVAADGRPGPRDFTA